MNFSVVHSINLDGANITFTFDCFNFWLPVLRKKRIQIAIAGGGAAGFFAAIQCASVNHDCDVTIFEKSSKVLAKVKVSGGGRCNVTHACFDIKQFIENYPRGNKQLYGVFSRFSARNTVECFENRGVKLKAE